MEEKNVPVLVNDLGKMNDTEYRKVMYFLELIHKGNNPYYVIPDSVTEGLSEEDRAEVLNYFNQTNGGKKNEKE